MMLNSNPGRRRFLGTVAASLAAARLGMPRSARASSVRSAADDDAGGRAGSPTAFADVKQIDAGLLDIGYADAGPANGPAVVLLHGWPYDIHSYLDVSSLLAAKGYRVIVPYLRGYGTTRFLSSDTVRNAQQSVVALDVIHLMDALHIQKAIIGGFDWGSRTAAVMGALWPERCKALVCVSGYLVTSLTANRQPLPPAEEYGWWYQYYFATERGAIGYAKNRNEFNRLIWKNTSPQWNFDPVTFDRTAASFDNPDHVAIVIHNYRWRLSLANGERQYEELEQRLSARPVITVPTITIASDFDGAGADGSAYVKQFVGKYSHRILEGVGHNVPQEAPREFARAIVDADA